MKYKSLSEVRNLRISTSEIDEINYLNGIEITQLVGVDGVKIAFNRDIVLKKLKETEELYNSLDSKQMDKDVVLLDAYHSATIEGAKTTINEVKRAIEKDVFNKNTNMVADNLLALSLAYDKGVKSLDDVIEIWKIVTKNVCDNRSVQNEEEKFRHGMVYVNDGVNEDKIFRPEKPENIEKKMKLLESFIKSNELNKVIAACIIHFFMVHIHPFCDGNGRTARICFNGYMYHCGYEKIASIAISKTINENKIEYYKSLEESEEKEYIIINNNRVAIFDITPSILFMIEVLNRALISAIMLKNKLNESEKKVKRK